MILIDANLLLYAYNSAEPRHEQAKTWLESVLSQPGPVLIPWTVILAFLRVSTNPRAWPTPFTIEEATAAIAALIAAPNVSIIQPGPQHWQILSDMVKTSQCRDAIIMDAHLATLAVEHGATLCTNDRDFRRFAGLKVLYPLLDA